MKVKLLVFKYLICNCCFSQNIVANGGFDNLSRNSNFKNAWPEITTSSWGQLIGSPDIFIDSTILLKTFGYAKVSKYSEVSNTGEHYWGSVTPKSGKTCLGMLVGKEAVSGILNKPMLKDSVYDISFFIRGHIWQNKITKFINITFSSVELKNSETLNTINLETINLNSVRFNINRTDFERTEWIELHGEYKAKGGECFIYIGLQKPCYQKYNKDIEKMPKVKYRKRSYYNAYHYFDNFCVKLNSTINCANEKDTFNGFENQKKTDKIATSILQKYILEDILFRTGFSDLTESTKIGIDLIIPSIKNHLISDSINILILGYTDIKGNEDDNLKLSINRARSVMMYLIECGIDSSKIKIEGKGSKEPISSNSSASGRAKNRRVEILIVK